MLGTASCGVDTAPPPKSLIGRFDLLWETFDREYSYFAYKQINWDSLRTVYRPQAEAVETRAMCTVRLKNKLPFRGLTLSDNA